MDEKKIDTKITKIVCDAISCKYNEYESAWYPYNGKCTKEGELEIFHDEYETSSPICLSFERK